MNRTPRRPGRHLHRRPAPVVAAVLFVASFGVVAEAWVCQSDVALGPTVSLQRKGLALDDSTFRGCPSRIPSEWPNTGQQVTSLRLFQSWDESWPSHSREDVWHDLRDFAQQNAAKIFVGSKVTCDAAADARDWANTLDFIQTLGTERVMGVSVGNELDILWSKDDESVTPECIQTLWEGGRLWEVFQQRVADLDRIGLGSVPITSVFTGAVFGDGPIFMEQPGKALVNTFTMDAVKMYGRRYVFVFNLYPYFDPNFFLDYNSTDRCTSALAAATCWSGGCSVPQSSSMARQKARQMMSAAGVEGSGDALLWIGETGWSSPKASTLGTAMASCTAWSSRETLRNFYNGFLGWRLDSNDDPDHVFYFTVRDSFNFDREEYFGLTEDCMDHRCKLRSPGFVGSPQGPAGHRLFWVKWVWLAAGAATMLVVALLLCCAYRRARREKAAALTLAAASAPASEEAAQC